MDDEVPCLFKMVLDELASRERAASCLTNDAFGVGESTVPFCQSPITKDMAVAALENLEYYEKVRDSDRTQGCGPP